MTLSAALCDAETRAVSLLSHRIAVSSFISEGYWLRGVRSADTLFHMRLPLVLVLSFVLFGCGTNSGAGSSDSSSPKTSQVVQVTIEKMQFSVPSSVSHADDLELVNNDSVSHNLMLMDESFSVDVGPGKTVALPQFKPGEYSFHCHIHPTMIATLTVS